MSFQQPLQNIQVPEAVQNIGANVSNVVEQVKTSFNTSVAGFSQQAQAGTTASQDFLQSNTIIAKFAFLILIIIAFVILMALGIYLIQYFSSPAKNPYLIYGMASGSNSLIIPGDPAKSKGVLISRSNNQSTGLEFTWSCWLFINGLGTASSPTYQHIFNKGDTNYDATTGLSKVNNSPGVYLKTNSTTEVGAQFAELLIKMDTNNITTNSQIPIDNIPIRKWVHIVLRMENTIMDVYVNGIVSNRLLLQSVPKQNYNDVNISQNGGFNGNISNLRYYSYALNAFEINNIVYSGPNTISSASNLTSANSGSTYLSNLWYTNR